MQVLLTGVAVSLIISVVMVFAVHVIANYRLEKQKGGSVTTPWWQTPAFLIRRIGLYAGVTLGALAVSENILAGLRGGDLSAGLLLESAIGLLSLILFMFTALQSVDWLILSKVKNNDEIADNNIAVGITEGTILLSTGLVAYGALLGEGHILSSWVFFLIGQVFFILTSYLMEYVIHPSHNAKTEIERGDMGSGILVSAALIVVAMFVKNGIAGDFYGFAQDIPYFLKIFGLQMGAFLVYLFLLEPLLMLLMKMPKGTLRRACVRSVVQVGVGVVLVNQVAL